MSPPLILAHRGKHRSAAYGIADQAIWFAKPQAAEAEIGYKEPNEMIAAFDVQYDPTEPRATAAAVVFEHWTDAAPAAEYSCNVENILPYVPGQFFRRELPCLLAVMGKIKEPITLIVVDSYVQLDDKPGLGQHLFDHLNQTIPVIGVAKTSFHGAHGVEVLRGTSTSPLFVTAAGYDVTQAVNHVRAMHGPHRIPTMLKRVDQLARAVKFPPV